MHFIKIKNEFINAADIKSFKIECAKEYTGDYDYTDGMRLSDIFLIITFTDNNEKEFHYRNHRNSHIDEFPDFENTLVTLTGRTDSIDAIYSYLRQCEDYRDGESYE